MNEKLFQKELASILGVSIDTVTNWENNQTKPMVKHKPWIMKFLGCSQVYIEKPTLVNKTK